MRNAPLNFTCVFRCVFLLRLARFSPLDNETVEMFPISTEYFSLSSTMESRLCSVC
jgi:hypothetical protein